MCRRRDGLHVWVPRRSYDKPTFPGELDNTVAGGQPAGIGLHENLIKECAEEASIPRALAAQAKAVSFVAYLHQSGPQLKPDVMTCFDLELPEDFTPTAHRRRGPFASSCGRSRASSRPCATPPSSNTTAISC